MYIVSPDQYRKYYNKGLLKYIPKKYRPKIRPKLLTLIKNKEGKVVGKAIGIFSSYEGISADNFIDVVIKGIEKFREEETQKIIFEDLRFLDQYSIKIIEEKTKLKIINGEKVMAEVIPIVLKELFLEIGEKSTGFEVLLIANDKEYIRPLLKELSKIIRFITVYAEDHKKIEKVKEEILLETGLSIYCTKNIDKTLRNYYIIINLNNNIRLSVDKLKDKCIIFNFTNKYNISKEIRLKNKDCIVINDFLFRNNNLFFQDESIIKLKDEIPSRLYEFNNQFRKEDLKGLIGDMVKYTPKKIIRGLTIT